MREADGEMQHPDNFRLGHVSALEKTDVRAERSTQVSLFHSETGPPNISPIAQLQVMGNKRY